jgi:hypothetical protein
MHRNPSAETSAYAAGTLARVPNQPKTPNRAVRVDDELWQEAGQAAAAAGTDRTKLLNQFLRWYLRRPGAALPERPERAR